MRSEDGADEVEGNSHPEPDGAPADPDASMPPPPTTPLGGAMPDAEAPPSGTALDALADGLLEEANAEEPRSGPRIDPSDVRWIDMPSVEQEKPIDPADVVTIHLLDETHPDAPVPRHEGEVIIHRAVLSDSTGLPAIFDWIADGNIAVIELSRLIDREIEFADCVRRMQTFVEGDLSGQMVQIGRERLILLPPGHRGMQGVDDEVFALEP